MTRGRARARARTRVHFATDTLSQSKGTGNSGHREHFSRRRWGFAGLARVDSLLALALSHARKKSPELQVITTRHTQPELCWERGGDKTLFVGCDRCLDGDPRLCSTLPCSTCVELGGHGVYLESCFFYKSGVFTPKDVEVCLSGCFPDPLH